MLVDNEISYMDRWNSVLLASEESNRQIGNSMRQEAEDNAFRTAQAILKHPEDLGRVNGLKAVAIRRQVKLIISE